MTDTILQDYAGTLSTKADSGETALRDALLASRLPSSKSESYRYARLHPLKSQSFGAAPTAQEAAMTPLNNGATLVSCINGAVHLPSRQIDGLEITHLDRKEIIAAERSSDSLALINQTMAQGGLCISASANLSPNTVVEIHHQTLQAEGQAAYSSHMIKLEENAELTIIEYYNGDETNYWLSETMTIELAQNSKLTHIRILNEGANAIHTARADVSVTAEAHYHHFTMAKSAAESRFELTAHLTGAGGHVQSDGVILARNKERHEINTRTIHNTAGATSDQIIRSIAADQGQTTFQGMIRVVQDAQKTEADQSSRAILLDRTAQANTKPELEIFADDVKCSHGATVGELDRDALFYLISRGISPTEAYQMLVTAFAGDALVALTDHPVFETLSTEIEQWMLARSGSGIHA